MDCDYNRKSDEFQLSVNCDTMVDPLLGPATEHCCKCKPECFNVVCNGRIVPMSWVKPINTVVLSIVGTLFVVMAVMYALVEGPPWMLRLLRKCLCMKELENSENSAATQQSQDHDDNDNVVLVVTAVASITNGTNGTNGNTNANETENAVHETANLDDVNVEGA